MSEGTAGSRASWEFQKEGPSPEPVSGEGYTPSLEEVRDATTGWPTFALSEGEFDRWLAADRTRIWAECDAAIVAHVERNGTSVEGWPANPYRKGGDA